MSDEPNKPKGTKRGSGDTSKYDKYANDYLGESLNGQSLTDYYDSLDENTTARIEHLRSQKSQAEVNYNKTLQQRKKLQNQQQKLRTSQAKARQGGHTKIVNGIQPRLDSVNSDLEDIQYTVDDQFDALTAIGSSLEDEQNNKQRVNQTALQKRFRSMIRPDHISSIAYREQKKLSNRTDIANNAKKYTTGELESQMEDVESGIGQRASNLNDLLKGNVEANRPQIDKNQKEMSDLIKQKGLLQGSMKYQSRRGIDDISVQRGAEDMFNKLSKHEREKEVRGSVRIGMGGDNLSDLTKNLEKAMTETAEAAKKLKNVTDTTSDEFKDASSDYADSVKKMEDAQVRHSEGKRQVRDKESNFNSKIQKAQNVMAVAGAAVDVGKFLAISQPLERDSLRTRFAGYTNDLYDDAQAGAGGDMKSLRRYFVRQGSAKDRADSGGTRAQVAEGADLAMNVGKGVIGGMTAYATGGLMGVGQTADAVGGATKNVVRLADGTAKASGKAAFFESNLKLQDAMSHIDDKTNQAYIGGVRSNFMASIGGGTGVGRDEAYGLGNRITTGILADRGVSMTEARQLQAQGISQMGNDYSNDADFILQNAAKNRERGTMSGQAYVSNVAKLTQAGAGTDDLEDIIRKATAAGMDSSKAISQLVTASTASAQMSSNTGLNIASQYQDKLIRTASGLDGMGLSESQRLSISTNATNLANATSADESMNLENVVEFSRTRNRFGGVKGMGYNQMRRLNKATGAELDSLINSSGEERNKIAKRMGLDTAFGNMDQDELTKKLVAQRTDQRMQTLGGMGLNQFVNKKEYNAIRDKITEEPNISQEDLINSLPKEMQSNVRAAFANEGQMAEASIGSVLSNEVKKKEPANNAGQMKHGSDAMKGGAQAEVTAFNAGMDKLGGVMDQINATMIEMGKIKPETFVEGMQKGLKDFEIPGGAELLKAGTKLEKAGDILFAAATKMADISHVDLDKLDSKISNNPRGKKSGSSGGW